METNKLRNNNKKKIVFLVLTIIMCLGISLGAVYFIYTFKDTRENSLATGLVSITYTEGTESVNIENAVPVIDDVGLTNTPYAFTVKNTSAVPINIRFQIVTDTNNTIPIGAVRYALYIDDQLIQKDNIGSLNDNTLYVLENFKAGETINAKLIFWVDYYYEKPNEVFSAKIKVTGESFDYIAGKPLNEVFEKAITDNTSDTCKTSVVEDGITYISGTKDCINFNYVWYSGKLWRITAIYPDGTMKMITDDAITSINYGSDVNFYTDNENKSWIYQWLNEDFLDTLYNHENIIVTDSKWNVTNSNAASISDINIKLPETTMVTAKVGLLNSYEYYMSYKNTTYADGYLHIGYDWWLLNPYSSSYIWGVRSNGEGYNDVVSTRTRGTRPSVTLKSTIALLSGSGTKSDPYKIAGDKEEATPNTTLLNTRSSGEYVEFDGDLYRIVGIENNATKINKNDYVRDTADAVVSKNFSNNVTYGSGTTTDSYWDYYLNNTWYHEITANYKNMLVEGTYYLGTTSNSYKGAICTAPSNTVTTKDCPKTTSTWTGYVGLPRYGEMFASQQGNYFTSSSYMWLITPSSSTKVWYIYSYGNGSGNLPESTTYATRPSLYLTSSVKITSGTGTPTDPYEISE